jgi:mono/diheme cytochrome c family protein
MRNRLTGPVRVLLLAALTGVAAAGCMHQKEKPAIEYMPDMAYSDRVAAQHEDPLRPDQSVMREPVPGTVPRDYTPYRFAQGDTAEAALAMVNPLSPTPEVLARGQKLYMTFCVVCHGPTGDGQGYIVPKFPQPPQLYSDRAVNWTDGRIFHMITRGLNLMPSYAAQILPEDRWAIVYYVRALQRAARPTPSDLAAAAALDTVMTTAAAPPAAGGK